MAAITALAFALLSADWLIASQGKSGGRKTPLIQTGLASWYGKEFKGGKTASGERYDPEEMTAAHRTLPFGTIVRVINLRNNKSVTVRITNRGPFVRGRIVDVSRAAAHKLDMMKSGVTRVRIEVVQRAGD
ncbi:MAG: septal ring lytic transglycosylase RlpA family protein [Terrimicrobiaceae bacterium]